MAGRQLVFALRGVLRHPLLGRGGADGPELCRRGCGAAQRVAGAGLAGQHRVAARPWHGLGAALRRKGRELRIHHGARAQRAHDGVDAR